MAIDLNLEGSFISLALERPHNEFTSKRKLQSPLFFWGGDFSPKMLQCKPVFKTQLLVLQILSYGKVL